MEHKKSYEEYMREGSKLLKDGKHELALACCDKAIELDFTRTDAHNLRGNFNMEIGKYAEAMVDF